MIPEILIACGARTREVGPDLNLIRRRLIKAVLTDTELLALTVNSRSDPLCRHEFRPGVSG
jgi:hypothetical protein